MVYGLVICLGLAGQPVRCREVVAYHTLEQCERARMNVELRPDESGRCTERPGRPTFEVRRPTFGIRD
jgi:hypothetical protein